MSKKNTIISPPAPDEYPAYAEMYMKWVSRDGQILQSMKDQIGKTMELVSGLSDEQLAYRYAPGKWTIPEVMVHICDDERIYAYRALRIGRGDQTPLPGFEQDDYVPFSKANGRSVKSILKEYRTVRKATLSLFRSFNAEDLLRRGTSDGQAVSVRALLYHLAGHELHHLEIINEKYLK
jgi:uncharacterized damage-inducible protein DinB